MEQKKTNSTLEAIRVKMLELGLKNQDLVPAIGSRGYVSNIISGRKPITLATAKKLREILDLPTEIFLN